MIFKLLGKALFTLGLCLLTSALSAQEFSYNQYALKDCAFTAPVVSVCQDNQGNILMLQNGVLYRFDGLNCRSVNGSGDIQSLAGSAGQPIFAMRPSGLSQVISQADSCHLEALLPCQEPVQVYSDPQSQTWIAQRNGTIVRIQNGKQTTYLVGHSIADCFFTSLNGVLWMVANHDRWYWFSGSDDRFVAAQTPALEKGAKLFLKRTEHTIWVASVSGIAEVTIAQNQPRLGQDIVQLPDVTCMVDDGKNYIYLGTAQKGLFRIGKGDHKHTVNPVFFSNTVQNIEKLPFQSVYALCVDRDHGIWISSELGMSHLHAKTFLTFYGQKPLDDWVFIQQGVNKVYYFNTWGTPGTLFRMPAEGSLRPISVWNTGNASIYSIACDQADVWASNTDGKIFRCHDNKPAGIIDLSKRGGAVFQLYADSKHRIWFAQAPEERSLPGTSYTDQSLKVRYFSEKEGLTNRILCFQENRAKQLYAGGVGAQHYLFVFDEKKQVFINLSLPLPFEATNLEVHDIVCDAAGDLWLGTTHGLLQYNVQTKSIKQVDLGERLITLTEVRALALDKQGQLWIGTDVYGLLCYVNGQAIRYQLSDGVPSKGIYYRSIIIDQGDRIWVGTDAGFSFSRLNATQIIRTVSPTLYRLTVNDKIGHLVPGKALKVPYHANLFIHFHSISYPASKLVYQWRIHGQEDKWSEESSANQMRLPILDHGLYRIQIRARQMGYGWSEPLNIPVQVLQVWYLQDWAYFVYVALLLALIAAITHFNSRRLYLKNIRLQKMVALKTKELQEKNQEISAQNQELKEQNQYISQQAEKLESSNLLKDRLFSIVSHDLRGPLGSMKGVLSLASNGLIMENEFKAIAPHLLKELDSTSFLLDNLLYWAKNQMEGVVLNLEARDLFSIAEQQLALFDLNATNKGVSMKNAIPQGTIVTIEVQMIGIVLRNLLANALKFCRKGDTVEVRVQRSDTQLHLFVEDTGIGMSVETQAKLFQPNSYTRRGTDGEYGTGLGLMICKEYLEKMGGTIRIISTEGVGSIFCCVLPQLSPPLQPQEVPH